MRVWLQPVDATAGAPAVSARVTTVTAMTTAPPPPTVQVRRSARRKRTVSAFRDGDTVVVSIPARMSAVDERRWVATMLERLARSERRRRPTDEALSARAADLSIRYLEGRARPKSVRWVDNQVSRWGSCTPADGSVRLSSRLQDLPGWVLDYVLVHELAHLLEGGHTERFWRLVGRYPKAERARGFLDGVAYAARLPANALDTSPPPADRAQ